MEFESQICTTNEQSERLLALGLKKETADMCLDYMGNVYTYPISIIETIKNDWSLIPLWSLDRLLEIAKGNGVHNFMGDNRYDDVISLIQSYIHLGHIDEEYLNMNIVNARENTNIELLMK